MMRELGTLFKDVVSFHEKNAHKVSADITTGNSIYGQASHGHRRPQLWEKHEEQEVKMRTIAILRYNIFAFMSV